MTTLKVAAAKPMRQRHARAVDDAGEEVAAEIVDAEPELRRREGQRLRQEGLRVGLGLGEERRKDRGEDQDQQHDAADDRRLVGDEAPPGEIERAPLPVGGRRCKLGDGIFELRCSLPVVSEPDARIEPGVGDVGEEVGEAEHQRDHQHQRHLERIVAVLDEETK